MKKKVRHVKILGRCGMLRHAAACFKTPMCSSKKQVLRHAAACCGCTSLTALGAGEASQGDGDGLQEKMKTRRSVNGACPGMY